jgi:carotenoid cleavage dioxygenase
LHEFPEWLRPDEAFFVPASSDAAEDEGYLLTYVFDRTTDRTSLFILDASNVSAPPLAEVRLPFRVPAGFHGLWVPA